jgi:DNA-binding beta-propeller fold protein YncE
LLTPTGLTAWTFSLTGYNLTNNISDNIGCMKISSDGSKLVICHYGTNRVYLYDFNNQTGVVDNERLLSSTFIGPYGCEFSENARYVYIGYNSGLNIHGYDTNNASPASTRVSLAANVGMFVGSFQRIGSTVYIAQRGTTFLDAITNADAGGVFNQNYLATTNTVNFGLNQVLYPDLTPPPIIMTD